MYDGETGKRRGEERQEWEREHERLSKRDRAKAHKVRGSILALLAKDKGAELTASEIRGHLPGEKLSAPNLAYHLCVLKRTLLVSATEDDPPRYRLSSP